MNNTEFNNVRFEKNVNEMNIIENNKEIRKKPQSNLYIIKVFQIKKQIITKNIILARLIKLYTILILIRLVKILKKYITI